MNDFTGHPNQRLATEKLISELAHQRNDGQQRPFALDLVLISRFLIAAVMAVITVIVISRPRADLAVVWTSWAFQYKVIGMLLLIGGGIHMTRSASIPGSVIKPALTLFPAFLFLACGLAFDSSGFPMMGTHVLAVPVCVGTIIAASLGPLLVLLLVIRRGVPTRPRLAGGVAGLLSGSIGALAYTLACINDGAGFVMLWYTLAIAIVSAIGAIIGAKALSW